MVKSRKAKKSQPILTIKQTGMGKLTVLNGSLPSPIMVLFKLVPGAVDPPARIAHPAYRMEQKFELITPVVFTLTDEGTGRLSRTKIKGSRGDYLVRYNNLLMYLSAVEFNQLFEELP